ncbi:MAG: SPOR domain-containing protein [Bacteroidetes bacterium]|nr:SPOR domain-containing protein [Bacteroidota bacterium]
MDIKFENHLLELLTNNACVIIPNFGGFINKDIPSQINGAVITPPSKQLAFNQYLTHDDELLTGALMQAHQLSYEDAKNKVLNYSNHIQYSLKKHHQFKINKIGSFKVNEQNQIVFQPFLNNLSAKSSFGLQAIHFQPLVKQVAENKIVAKEKAEKTEILKTERKKTKRQVAKGALFGFIGSFLLMAGVAGLMITNTQIGTVAHQKAGFSDMLFPKTEHVNSFGNRKIIERKIKVDTSTPKELADKGRVYTISEQNIAEGYYVVLGSYSTQSNATRLEDKLFNEGEDTYVVPADNGFYRVCKYVGAEYTKANETLTAERNESNKDLWLIKNLK